MEMELNEALAKLKAEGALLEYTSMYSALSDFFRYLKVKAPKTGYDLEIEGDENQITVKFGDNTAKVTLEQFDEDEDAMLYVEAGGEERAFYNEHTDFGPAMKFIIKKICPTNESVEDTLSTMAANSYEGQVDGIVEEIELVKPVKNYYEVDPDDDSVKAQFEIVMQDDTVWEVQFRKGHGYWWRGNVYPWRIIKNNNGGFIQIAFSLSQLHAYMKKVKAIQSESVNESTDNYREIVTKKLAQIYDNCYDSDDAGRSYAEKHVADFEPQIAEVLEEGGDSPISPYEVAEVIWYMLHHSQLMGRSILGVYMQYTRNEPDYFESWYQFNP